LRGLNRLAVEDHRYITSSSLTKSLLGKGSTLHGRPIKFYVDFAEHNLECNNEFFWQRNYGYLQCYVGEAIIIEHRV